MIPIEIHYLNIADTTALPYLNTLRTECISNTSSAPKSATRV
jgi:hypothetical protein